MVKKHLLWLVMFTLLISLATADCAYYFYGENCPGCADTTKFLDKMEQENKGLNVEGYEVYYNPQNADLLKKYFTAYSIPEKSQGLPAFFSTNSYFIGNDPIKTLSAKFFADNLVEECPSLTPGQVVGIVGENSPLDVIKTLSFITVTSGAFKDAFHPGMLALVLLLLIMLITVKSEKRMFGLGLRFILSVYAVYFVFSLGLLTSFAASQASIFFYRIVGLLAIIYGLFIMKTFLGKSKEKENEVTENFLHKVFSPYSVIAIAIITSLLSFAKISPTFLSLRFAFRGTSGWLALPIILYYLLIVVLPLIFVLIILIFLKQKYAKKAAEKGEKADLWREHHHKLMTFGVGVVSIILGIIVLFL